MSRSPARSHTVRRRSRRPSRSRSTALISLAGIVTAGVAVALTSGPVSADGVKPIGDPIPDVRQGAVQVGLQTVTSDVTAPLAGIVAPGRDRMLYLVDQVGQLKELDLDASRPVAQLRTVLDVSSVLAGPVDPKDERGFLGAAFAPDGRLFTYTSEAYDPATPATFPLPADPPGPCDLRGVVPDHRSVVREWEPSGTDPSTFEPLADSRVLLTVDQPQSNHNAGDLKFGPDGMLYIAFGDGGGADDQNCQTNFDGNPMFGHGANGNGQNPTNPLGDILRIDVNGANAANGRYGIPADNPFVTSHPRGELPEIFATGFRNPFRFSFDRADFTAAGAKAPGTPWVGDVGQNDVEEVDVVRPGGNYGWRVREGGFAFDPGGFQLKGSRSDASCSPGPAVTPCSRTRWPSTTTTTARPSSAATSTGAPLSRRCADSTSSATPPGASTTPTAGCSPPAAPRPGRTRWSSCVTARSACS